MLIYILSVKTQQQLFWRHQDSIPFFFEKKNDNDMQNVLPVKLCPLLLKKIFSIYFCCTLACKARVFISLALQVRAQAIEKQLEHLPLSSFFLLYFLPPLPWQETENKAKLASDSEEYILFLYKLYDFSSPLNQQTFTQLNKNGAFQ